MRRLAVMLVLLAAAGPVRAQTVDIIEYGAYVTSGDSPSPDNKPDAVVELRSVHDPRFVEQTDVIPAQLCQRFGIRFVLRPGRGAGLGTGLPLPVEIHVEHPPLHNPDGRSSDSEEWPVLLVPGVPSMAGFDFDQSWEIEAGTWTISVRLNGRVLASRAFEVTHMPGGGGAGDGCQHLS